MSETTMKSKFIKSSLLFFLILIPLSLFATEESSQQHEAYKLGAGDIIKITVFNQSDLSGEYTISGTGQISLALIGSIEARNLTLLELKQRIIGELKPDYLLNPRVSIEVLNFRPFYILGEVNNPQSYPYVDGMSYLNAVAIAGGFTYRAKKGYVMVIHANDETKTEIELLMKDKVMPGDMIRVDERFF